MRLADGADGEAVEGAAYVWVEEEGGSDPSEPTDPPTVPVEAELLVVPADYAAGTWSGATPTFALSVVPDTLQGYTFAVAMDGGEALPLEGASYAAAVEGQHS